MIVASVVLGTGGGLVSAATAAGPTADESAHTGRVAVAALGAELRRVTGNHARIDERPTTGNVTFLGASAAHPLQPARSEDDDPGQTARRFVNRYGAMFGVADPSTELAQPTVFTSSHGDAVRFEQRFRGVPVLAGQVAVQIDPNGAVVSTSGEASPRLSLDVQPSVSAATATATALAVTSRADGAATTDLAAGTPELTVYDPALIGALDPVGARLAWKVQVRNALGDVNRLVLVDAHTGAIALHFSQVAAGGQRDVCDNANNFNLVQTCTAPVIFSNGTGYGAAGVEAKHAFDFAGQTYDFLLGTLGRDSLDGSGLFLHSTVRFCPSFSSCPYANAFWNEEQMVYGDGFASADDVVAHELTHGLTQFTSGLLYYADAGAINESMSDVFGEFVDRQTLDGGDGNWLLGEDLTIGAVRSMKDPTTAPFGDPDSVLSANFVTALDNDNRGVHTNSGVNNKAAYLIAQTDTPTITFNGQTIRGLGITKAAKIYYQAETTLLGPGSDYTDLFNVLPQACTNLIGQAGITADDCQQVVKAVTATAMNQHPASGNYFRTAPVCDSGVQNAVQFHDDTSTVNGAWAGSTTGGGATWEYLNDISATGGKTLHVLDAARPSGTSTLTGQTPIPIPAGTTYLRFDHSYHTDWDGGGLYDGGVVEYSGNGGASWTDLGSLAVNNGYDAPIVAFSSGGVVNPLAGLNAFGRISPNFQTSRYDLSSLAGQTIRIRFRFGTDNYPNLVYDGWYIDDISVYSCGAPQVPGAPGNVSATGGTGSAGLTWTPPSSDGGAAISGYRITPFVNGVAQTATETNGQATAATVGNLAPATAYVFTVAARNSIGLGAASVGSNQITTVATTPPPPPTPRPPTPPDFSSLVPARLLETRPGRSTADGQFNGIGLRGAGTVTVLTVTGRGGVSGDASAVALNVTVTDAQAAGFLTVYPCGGDPPNASHLNYRVGSTVPNAVVSKVGANGQVCFFTQSPIQLVVDANGFFGPGSSLVPLVPARLLDSRPGQPTFDGRSAGIGVRPAGSVTEVQVTGRTGIPGDASAAVLNVTVTDAQAPGYATVYPCGTNPPAASNLNYVVSSTTPNAVVSKIGTNGRVCVFTQSAIQLVVDVNGYFPATARLVSILPARLLETRSGMSTIDGQLNGIGLRSPGSITQIQVTGRAGVPANATSVVLNVTVTEAQAPGYATVYPCDASPPNASNLNYDTGATVANAVLSKLGAGGVVCVFTQSATHIVADVNGYFTG